MTAGWRYAAVRLNGDGTETLLDPDLPLGKGVGITTVLSGPGALTAAIQPAVARLVGSDGQPLLQRWSTAIYPIQNDVIRGGFLVDKVTRIAESAQLALQCVGFSGRLKDQPYDGSNFFVEADPLDIVRHIWDHWQTQSGGDVGMILDRTTKSGKTIGTELEQVEFDTQNGPVSFEAGPYKLNEWENHDLGGDIDSLATDQGFDWVETHRWSNGVDSPVEHHIDFGVPRIGKRRNDLRFVVGENVIDAPDEEFNPDTYASEILVLGAGDGRTMKRGRAGRPGEPRLRRVVVLTDKSLKSDTACRVRAAALLPQYEGKPEISEISVRQHDNAPIGSWRDGDEIELQTMSEWGDASYPVRILSTTYTPDDLSVARLAVMRADMMPS